MVLVTIGKDSGRSPGWLGANGASKEGLGRAGRSGGSQRRRGGGGDTSGVESTVLAATRLPQIRRPAAAMEVEVEEVAAGVEVTAEGSALPSAAMITWTSLMHRLWLEGLLFSHCIWRGGMWGRLRGLWAGPWAGLRPGLAPAASAHPQPHLQLLLRVEVPACPHPFPQAEVSACLHAIDLCECHVAGAVKVGNGEVVALPAVLEV